MYRAAATHQATASAGGDALVSGEITGDWGHTNVGDIGGGGEVAGGPGTGAEARVGVGVGGDGFVTALRLLCSAAQPYLAALHRWLDVGELSDPSGELFVAAGSAAAADVGTEAHWDKGFMLRRRPSRLIQSPTSTSTPTSLGEVECPEFFAGCAEELMAAGKSVQLLRHNRGGWSDAAREDVNENGEVGETWGDHWRGRVNQDNRSGRDKRSGRSSRGGVQPENGGSSGSTEDDGEVATAAVPEMSHHLCVEFCEGIRIAIEPLSTAPPAAVAIAEAGGAGEVGIDDWGPGWHRDSEADESFRLLSGMSLEACPPHPDAAVAHATAATGASAAWEETCALLAAGLTGSSTRVAPFVGEWLEWGGGPFERPPALAAAAALDAWLAASTAARSPATCPVAALLVRSAVAPARRRATAVAAALMARLRGEWRLQRSLAALRAVYLGGAGEATAVFSAAVFARLDQYGAAPTPGPAAGTMADVGDRSGEWAVWSDPSELSAALAEALTMDDSGELPDPRDVSVEIVSRSPDNPPGQRRRPSAARGGDGESEAGGSGGGGGTSAATAVAEEDRNQLGEGTVQLEALSSLRLSLRIPWPLTLVIPESCLERYNAAAVFLLQVRRARAALEEVVRSGWSAAARRTPGGGGGGGPHARGLAAELRHFVAALHEHVVARVLHSAWQELVAEVDKADSPGAARDAHAAFLDAAARQCLVSPDPTWTLLAAQVRAALAIACDFAAAHRRAAAAAAAAAADADPEVGMRLVGPAAAASPEAALEAAALLGYRPVPEDEAERLATAFRRARSYVLRVVESKLRLGTFPELAELRMRLDFNGFYGTDEDSGGGGGRGGGGCVYAAHRSDIHH
jgi:gamma-tubulin complex component 5